MDIALVESLNGGELVKKGNDLYLISGWGNMVYLALFGGNLGFPTKPRDTAEQAFDWWGNTVLMPQDESIQFNSNTEYTLNNTPLTSAGRLKIQHAVEKDLVFMQEFSIVKVDVVITGVNRVQININISKPDNLIGDQYKAFIFIWDGTIKNLVGDFSSLDFSDDFF